jgi:hypothetical protein
MGKRWETDGKKEVGMYVRKTQVGMYVIVVVVESVDVVVNEKMSVMFELFGC